MGTRGKLSYRISSRQVSIISGKLLALRVTYPLNLLEDQGHLMKGYDGKQQNLGSSYFTLVSSFEGCADY